MKAILIILVIAAGMVLLGWITFSRDDDSASMKIDTQEVQDDTEKAINKGKETVRDLRDGLDDESNDPENELRGSESADDELLERERLEEQPVPESAAPAGPRFP